jgi:hypothetical protein
MSKKFRENVEIISSAANTSGLRTNNMTSATPSTAGAKTIWVDATGVVVTVDPIAGSALFTLSDGTNTQTISWGDTFQVTAGNWLTATVSATDLLTLVAKLSADAGNDITFGTDGWLYLSKNSLLTNVTWNDATNNLVLTFDSGSTVNVPIIDNAAAFLMDLVISDWTTTDVVNNHETLTFAGADKIRPTVTANTVTYDLDTTWAVAWQSLTFDWTNVVWDNPTADRYVNAYTPTANVATTHTHGLATTFPIVQVYDTTSWELIMAEVVRLSWTQFNVIVTTADPITVIWL